MKKFLQRTIIFIFFGLIIFEGIVLIAEVFPTPMGYVLDQKWLRTKGRINASKSKINNDTLYVGCSVAGQLLRFNGSNILTSNGSTYAIGNYFLIKNALENNENIKNVIYLSVPDVIGHNLTRKRTHHQFVKPFYSKENLEELEKDENLIDLLQRNEKLNYNLYNSYKILALDDFDYSDSTVNKPPDSLSMESIKWLSKIKELCKFHNVEFYLASPPVPISRKEQTLNWQKIKRQVKGTDLEDLFNIYFKTIIYLDDDLLLDRIHWKKTLIKNKRYEFLNYIHDQLK